MQIVRRFLTQHRLQRAVLWTLAVLTWMDGAVFGALDVSWRHVRQRVRLIWLPGLARHVGALVLMRALQLARPRQRKQILYWRRGRDLRRSNFRRSVIGSELRRALRHKDERAWIARLIAVLRNLDVYAARLARRLSRGRTRLWRLLPAIAGADALLAAPASAPASADSS